MDSFLARYLGGPSVKTGYLDMCLGTLTKINRRTEVTGRGGKRRKQLLDDFTEKRGYWKMKEKAVDRSVWRNGFVRGSGPGVWQAAE